MPRPRSSAGFATLTAGSVKDLLREHGPAGEVDLLSIDVDGNDYWLWRAIEAIDPGVVCIEYQDILGPERSVTIPYDPGFSRDGYAVNATANNYVGASRRAMVKLGESKGYRLVATNSYGFNAFFLRADLAADLIPTIAVEDGFPHAWNERGDAGAVAAGGGPFWEEVPAGGAGGRGEGAGGRRAGEKAKAPL